MNTIVSQTEARLTRPQLLELIGTLERTHKMHAEEFAGRWYVSRFNIDKEPATIDELDRSPHFGPYEIHDVPAAIRRHSI